jgi:hypothetical protein
MPEYISVSIRRNAIVLSPTIACTSNQPVFKKISEEKVKIQNDEMKDKKIQNVN